MKATGRNDLQSVSIAGPSDETLAAIHASTFRCASLAELTRVFARVRAAGYRAGFAAAAAAYHDQDTVA